MRCDTPRRKILHNIDQCESHTRAHTFLIIGMTRRCSVYHLVWITLWAALGQCCKLQLGKETMIRYKSTSNGLVERCWELLRQNQQKWSQRICLLARIFNFQVFNCCIRYVGIRLRLLYSSCSTTTTTSTRYPLISSLLYLPPRFCCNIHSRMTRPA